MVVSFETEGNFDKIIKKLQQLTDSDAQAALRKIGENGVAELQNATPKDSGETAASWDYKVKGSRKGPELVFVNNAHPELGVNIAVLKQVGHGTGTGGYVPPFDYIRPAMSKTFNRAGSILSKEMVDR